MEFRQPVEFLPSAGGGTVYSRRFLDANEIAPDRLDAPSEAVIHVAGMVDLNPAGKLTYGGRLRLKEQSQWN
jgi:hypothetical protein